MRKILIPIDFSETSINAVSYALQLFKYDKSDIIIMHAYADEVYDNTKSMDRTHFEEYKEFTHRQVCRRLKQEMNAMIKQTYNRRHNYSYEARFGGLVDATNEIVQRDNIDVVVMGTKGNTNKEDVTFGSRTLQVIKYVSCPVLAVPMGFHEYPVKQVLFPADYMIPYQRREVKLLNVMVKNFAARLHVVNVTKAATLSRRQEDHRSCLADDLDPDLTSFSLYPAEPITKGINELLAQNPYDMLVMVNHRHSYLENILYRSTIEKIGLEIKIPFLVLQNLNR